MKRKDSIKKISAKKQPVPRHDEIDEHLAKHIIEELTQQPNRPHIRFLSFEPLVEKIINIVYLSKLKIVFCIFWQKTIL
jgi:protein gp37